MAEIQRHEEGKDRDGAAHFVKPFHVHPSQESQHAWTVCLLPPFPKGSSPVAVVVDVCVRWSRVFSTFNAEPAGKNQRFHNAQEAVVSSASGWLGSFIGYEPVLCVTLSSALIGSPAPEFSELKRNMAKLSTVEASTTQLQPIFATVAGSREAVGPLASATVLLSTQDLALSHAFTDFQDHGPNLHDMFNGLGVEVEWEHAPSEAEYLGAYLSSLLLHDSLPESSDSMATIVGLSDVLGILVKSWFPTGVFPSTE